MAFSSNNYPVGPGSFPLGPIAMYPSKRVGNFGNVINPPSRVEDEYSECRYAKLPAIEKEYSSSVEKAKRRLKMGRKRDRVAGDDFHPRYKKGKWSKKPWKE